MEENQNENKGGAGALISGLISIIILIYSVYILATI